LEEEEERGGFLKGRGIQSILRLTGAMGEIEAEMVDRLESWVVLRSVGCQAPFIIVIVVLRGMTWIAWG